MLWVGWIGVLLVSALAVWLHMSAASRERALEARIEQQQQQVRHANEAAQRSGSAKATFLANMSHELRTPLNIVISYSDMLQEDAKDAGQEGMVEDLQRIHRAGHKLLDMINNMLELAEAEAGQLRLMIESFDLGELLDEVERKASQLLEKHGNSLQVNRGERLGGMRSDRHKLQQTLLNLVENATKFTKSGAIVVTVVRVNGENLDGSPGDRILITVADTGIGMSSEQTGRLFTPFSQIDGSTTREYGGTGMGLALSRQSCQLMGGDITVESRAGIGSSFTVILPVHAPQQLTSPLET